MIKFEKVSFEQFRKDCKEFDADMLDSDIEKAYNDIKIPIRATKGSAGYDFFLPFEHVNILSPYVTGDFVYKRPALAFPTGVRFITDEDVFLMCVPRSGLGFKYGLKMKNTCGIIDKDYWKSDNEGHIKASLVSDIDVVVEKGKAYMQGIILPYYKVDDDKVDCERNGGFGSTDRGKAY